VDYLIWNMTNLVAAILLPPMPFFILIGIGLWQAHRRRWARWLAICSLCVLMLISINAVSDMLLRSFEQASPPLDMARIQSLPKQGVMIVVLGGRIRAGALEYPEGETLGGGSLSRIRYAVRLSKAIGLPLAVSGGKRVGGSMGEGSLTRNFIETELRHPVALVEDKSLDTRQSAQFTVALIDPKKFHTIVLVTDVVHMPRAARAFEALGVKVIRAPTGYQSAAPLRPTDFLPSAGGLAVSTYALHEWLGEIWYRLRRASA
jgi:uncharacterized SAM-binding protein YcdF (DUF218 family)